ncbi:DUF4118 domain-containing protein [Rhizobium leguminosarum bv. viciae]|uniref:sensor histidine kinase n=1 Tax=Rhizobium TaxID=379 RepID=UPI00103A9A62|nr:HWE histidine kinase domain-containing protein [Rhizobium leguminosarum]TBZ67815.1 DUF4118 domain-containing protein [Rhizobium leguminosarum bv. viciae]
MTRFNFIKMRLLAGPPSLPWTVALGLGFVAVPTLFRLAADSVITGTAFSTFYPFVVIAALFIGWKGATGVALAAAVVANYLFMEPRYVLFAQTGDTIGVASFLISCAMIIFVMDTLRRTLIDLEVSSKREARLNSELKHLNGELQHRVKNILAIVQALTSHTFRGLPGTEEAIRKLNMRLHALAEAQAVLVAGDWESCHLPDLAVRALAPFNGQGAIRLKGPHCSLPERSCVPMVLALHELGTNALKYGSLSALDGTVEVRWQLRTANGDGTAEELLLTWTEIGGPSVEIPTRRGLGTKLVAQQTGIDAATMVFRPEGLVCEIVVKDAIAEASHGL